MTDCEIQPCKEPSKTKEEKQYRISYPAHPDTTTDQVVAEVVDLYDVKNTLQVLFNLGYNNITISKFKKD